VGSEGVSESRTEEVGKPRSEEMRKVESKDIAEDGSENIRPRPGLILRRYDLCPMILDHPTEENA
jgi:hypothetical protein